MGPPGLVTADRNFYAVETGTPSRTHRLVLETRRPSAQALLKTYQASRSASLADWASASASPRPSRRDRRIALAKNARTPPITSNPAIPVRKTESVASPTAKQDPADK